MLEQKTGKQRRYIERLKSMTNVLQCCVCHSTKDLVYHKDFNEYYCRGCYKYMILYGRNIKKSEDDK